MNMYDYILETPDVAKKIINNRENIFSKGINCIASNNFDEIIFVGSGSSYNAALTAKPLVESLLNTKVSCKYPYLFLNYENQINKNALYIVISQSGESKMVYETLKFIKDNKLNHLTFTSDLNSSIAKLGDLSIDISCGGETVPYKTKGYTCTYLAIVLLALEASFKKNLIQMDTYTEYVESLTNIINNLEKTINKSELWFENNLDNIKKSNSVLVIGTGSNYGTAHEAHLKIIETVRCFTSFYELEEYMHGPQNALSSENAIFVINSGNTENEKATVLTDYLKTKIDNAYLIGYNGDLNLDLISKEELSVIDITVAFQVIAYKLSQHKGVDLSKKRFEDFDKAVGKKVN